jgi:hypothetical protein
MTGCALVQLVVQVDDQFFSVARSWRFEDLNPNAPSVTVSNLQQPRTPSGQWGKVK